MEQEKDINKFDIPFAKRTNIDNSDSTLLKKLLIFSPFILFLFSLTTLQLIRKVELEPLSYSNSQTEVNYDQRILGHLPYNEIPKEKLVLIEPNIKVHIEMRDSLLEMREEAKKDLSLIHI